MKFIAMRTTEERHKEFKKLAVDLGISMGKLLELMMRVYKEHEQSKEQSKPESLVVQSGRTTHFDCENSGSNPDQAAKSQA